MNLLRRLLGTLAGVAAILLVSIGVAGFVGPEPARAATFCSCPDCPDSLDAAEAVVVGRVDGWSTVRNADGTDAVEDIPGLGQARVPVVVRVEVSQAFKGPVAAAILLDDYVYLDGDGRVPVDAPEWHAVHGLPWS